MPDRTSQRLQLRGGRWLGYAEYGDPAGRPVFYFQGFPGSRLSHPDEDVTAQLDARLIVIDRPGFGLSDFQPGRTLLDWPQDVVEVADQLGIERLPIVGISGGGPYVLACAHAIPQRLTAAAAVAGAAPFYVQDATREMTALRQLGAALARRAPWLLRPLLALGGNPRRSPERFLRRFSAGMCPADQAILAVPHIRAMFLRSYAEAARSGVRGMAWELRLFARPWGFRLEDISMPVHLWHGGQDHTTPPNMARCVAQTLPRCHPVFLPDQGHLFLFDPERWREILSTLLES
jgi:pimeloyl-ACP methyl ester carboxylesterase